MLLMPVQLVISIIPCALVLETELCCRINNAGSNGYKYGVLGDYTDAELVNIVETNVLGVMLGCREVQRL